MKLVFCAAPFAPTLPDSAYADEVTAARAAGFDTVLIDFEALVNDRDVRAAVRRVQPSDQPTPALYRGWMLKPALYAELYDALQDRGLLLINDPAAYQHCHYLPESYPIIAPHTPRTVVLPLTPNAPLPDLAPLLQPFGDRPLIVKDYVKSRKHEWHEACFIPSAADQAAVRRVVQRFVELQGDDLNAGLVFREFVALQPLAQHSKSGMPLTQEFRLWFVDGQRIFSSQYWEEGTYTTWAPIDLFAEVARQVQSRFFTMDVARTLDGGWLIVELGDGQVAGLPETADAALFYRALRAAFAT
ncbi:MAG: ATP-grasp domain-containing protein [Chloroflexi bacterium]|nr:ATP-grasp domain-containing protein [Chloroflexota bacterium]